MRYTENAYAKINLYLNVIGKRTDGYHEIESLMQQVSLCDTVSIVKNEFAGTSRITVTCTDRNIPTDSRNIVWKCAEAFFAACNIPDYDILINIEKHIPSAAGLAGGSSDGAAVLKLLDKAFCTNLPVNKLCEIGAKVGADIPFCIIGKTCICRGIGELLTPVELPRLPYSILIVFPGGGVSTPEAYRLVDEAKKSDGVPTLEDILEPMKNGKIPSKLYNSFENAILPIHARASFAKKRLDELGAVISMMSGSGPTVFGLYNDDKLMNTAAEILKSEGFDTFSCNAVE